MVLEEIRLDLDFYYLVGILWGLVVIFWGYYYYFFEMMCNFFT
jgi:hypothetical protein